MHYDVFTKLFEAIVEPVLFYGAGIWGHRYFPEVDTVLNKACRLFLGTSKNASNIATKGDMGWCSSQVKQKIETVRLWCRLKNMSGDRLCKKVHNWALSSSKSWEKHMIRFINDLNVSDIMLVNKPCKTTCIKVIKEKLIANDCNNWLIKLNSNGTLANGNKLRTYRTYKNHFCTEPYVKGNLRRDERSIIAKFRSCNLPLAIETGRFTRPKTPLTDRICKYCSANEIEDETHFLIKCEFFDDIRYPLLQSAAAENQYFHDYTEEQMLIYLMSAENLQRKIASCLQKMMSRRRSFSL